VGPLPESRNRNGSFDTITVVIDRLTGMVHLIPSRQIFHASDIAELLFGEIYHLHGLPKSIISDRDSLFNSIFWKHLHNLIGIKLHMSSAYHPESDGATERANRTIVQMIRQCVSSDQKDWVMKLPAVEFAINSARSEVTGYTPFFLNYGHMPRAFLWDSNRNGEYPGVLKFAANLKLAVIDAHDSIIAHQTKEIKNANKKRIPSPFEVGDLVYISSKNLSIPKGLARKFFPKYVGPYLITQNFKNDSYRIGISKNLKQRGIHDVFHSSLLRIHHSNDDCLFPNRSDAAIWEDNGQEWSVSHIKSHSGKRRDSLFEIVWKSGDVTWLPYHKVDHLSALEQYLEAQGIGNIDKLEQGKKDPPSNDEQILLGSIEFGEVFNTQRYDQEDSTRPKSSSPHHSLSSNSSLRPTISTMPETNWRAPKALINNLKTNFPFIYAGEPALWTIRDTTDPNYVSKPPVYLHFSPALMRSYNLYDHQIRSGNFTVTRPIGYSEFANIFNHHTDTLFGYMYWNEDESRWVSPPDRRPITFNDLDLLDYTLAIPPSKNNTLMEIGLADGNGHTKDDVVVNMTRAIVSSAIRKENELVQSVGYSGYNRHAGRGGLKRSRMRPYDKRLKRYHEDDETSASPSVPGSPIPPNNSTINPAQLMNNSGNTDDFSAMDLINV
jgi:hypothetical protein